jgi:CRISPR-associated protein Csm1
MTESKLEASCRLALAAYLHDLGKFAERARLDEALEKNADGNRRIEIDKQLYCPQFDGRYTHVHAAYTAIGFDLLEDALPQLVGADMAPFGAWKERDADDSLLNAATRHHKPDSFLQWIVATADRLASGFERKTFELYNAAPDETPQKLNHYTARQWTLLERIDISGEGRRETPRWRYPLQALSPRSIFPQEAGACEKAGNQAAQAEYRALWNAFKTGLDNIPKAHRSSLPLWLDHFDSLWQTFTHAIPSATAGGVAPDVSLHDHSRTTAALAVALWRYHADRGEAAAEVREQLRAQWDRERAGFDLSRQAWEEEKFLLIQGDFFGIQDFIFAAGGETQKRAAKLLRGRSFYVSLLSELAALRVLEALGLPPTSQVINAAGKFLIVAPNVPACRAALEAVQKEFDEWFLRRAYGQSGIGLATLEARAEHFKSGDAQSPFQELMKRLFERLEEAKLRRFDLCGQNAAPAVFDGFLDGFEHGECKIDGRSPAKLQKDGIWMSELAADQIDVGHWLATQRRVLITRESLNHHTLALDIFGYRVSFTDSEEETGKFGQEAKSGNLRRCWDFSLPATECAVQTPPSPTGRGAGGEGSMSAPLWKGYARRPINAYVPRFGAVNAWEAERYDGIENPEDFAPYPDEIKTLNHLARDDRRMDENGRWIGQEALMTLKGDVDNLGSIFQKGLERPTFAKMAGLSRQVNAFFAVYLPWLCQSEFPNVYTVFAGGDDFFLIGPWHTTLMLAGRMKAEFARYISTVCCA